MKMEVIRNKNKENGMVEKKENRGIIFKGNKLKVISTNEYLGSVVNENGKIDAEIPIRAEKAYALNKK